MREIKFRVWDSEENKMLYLDHVFFTNEGELVFRDFDEHYIDSYPSDYGEHLQERYKIMQYTPFKDRNGKDIYEGDILSEWVETDEGTIQSKYQVFWSEKYGSWHLDCSPNQDKVISIQLYDNLGGKGMEVTGNIYEK